MDMPGCLEANPRQVSFWSTTPGVFPPADFVRQEHRAWRDRKDFGLHALTAGLLRIGRPAGQTEQPVNIRATQETKPVSARVPRGQHRIEEPVRLRELQRRFTAGSLPK